MDVQPFTIAVPQVVLEDLQARLARTRWPDEVADAHWEYGVPLHYMQEIVAYWQHTFDWRAQEQKMNSFANYRTEIDGTGIHFIHVRGTGANPLPLLIAHGWPSSFYEMLDIIPLLTDPGAHGGDPADAFDVVVPSLPGYAFSDRPITRGFSYHTVADLLAKLMLGLGYQRFGAHAHDHGAAIMAPLLSKHTSRIVGYHTTEPSIPGPNLASDAAPLSAEERAYTEQQHWADTGYAHIQATRPQTLAYGLNDSPAGLAAWMVDKWWSWTDPTGNLEEHFTKDFLLANITVYWVTETVNAAARAYYEGRHGPARVQPGERLQVPLGVALVATQPNEHAPRAWVERLFPDIRRWVELPRGGHFVAGEEPHLLAEAIRAFFRPLR